MRGAKVFAAVAAAAALAVWGGVALAANEASKAPEASKSAAAPEASKATVHRVRGEVTAVDSNAKTMAVKWSRRKREKNVNVHVPDKASIREGKATKTLADIKVGDRVWMRYEQTNGKDVAEAIHILKPVHMAAKK